MVAPHGRVPGLVTLGSAPLRALPRVTGAASGSRGSRAGSEPPSVSAQRSGVLAGPILAGRPRVVRIGHEAARALDRYLRIRARHAQAHRPQLWLGVNNRGPMTANGIYQMIARRGRQAEVDAWTHRFRHHFSHTWLDRGGAEGDLMELNGWSSPQMLRRYGASARGARARRTYDRIMTDRP